MGYIIYRSTAFDGQFPVIDNGMVIFIGQCIIAQVQSNSLILSNRNIFCGIVQQSNRRRLCACRSHCFLQGVILGIANLCYWRLPFCKGCHWQNGQQHTHDQKHCQWFFPFQIHVILLLMHPLFIRESGFHLFVKNAAPVCGY